MLAWAGHWLGCGHGLGYLGMRGADLALACYGLVCSLAGLGLNWGVNVLGCSCAVLGMVWAVHGLGWSVYGLGMIFDRLGRVVWARAGLGLVLAGPGLAWSCCGLGLDWRGSALSWPRSGLVCAWNSFDQRWALLGLGLVQSMPRLYLSWAVLLWAWTGLCLVLTVRWFAWTWAGLSMEWTGHGLCMGWVRAGHVMDMGKAGHGPACHGLCWAWPILFRGFAAMGWPWPRLNSRGPGFGPVPWLALGWTRIGRGKPGLACAWVGLGL